MEEEEEEEEEDLEDMEGQEVPGPESGEQVLYPELQDPLPGHNRPDRCYN